MSENAKSITEAIGENLGASAEINSAKMLRIKRVLNKVRATTSFFIALSLSGCLSSGKAVVEESESERDAIPTVTSTPAEMPEIIEYEARIAVVAFGLWIEDGMMCFSFSPIVNGDLEADIKAGRPAPYVEMSFMNDQNEILTSQRKLITSTVKSREDFVFKFPLFYKDEATKFEIRYSDDIDGNPNNRILISTEGLEDSWNSEYEDFPDDIEPVYP